MGNPADRVERFLTEFLMLDFARRQKSKTFLIAGIVRDVDQSLVDGFGPRHRCEVRAQVSSRLADRVDVGGGPGRNAEELGRDRGVYSGSCDPDHRIFIHVRLARPTLPSWDIGNATYSTHNDLGIQKPMCGLMRSGGIATRGTM